MTGTLRKNRLGRWEVVGGHRGDYIVELQSGSVIQAFVQGRWLTTRIEHDGGDYYTVERGVRLEYGLAVRTMQ